MKSQIEHLSRIPIAIFAVACAIIAVIGTAAAIYCDISTPEIREVPIYINSNLVRLENKGIYLFFAPLFQIGVFLIFGYYALTWNRFTQRSAEIEKVYRSQYKSVRHVNFFAVYLMVCMIFFGFQILSLFQGLYSCGTILEMKMNKPI